MTAIGSADGWRTGTPVRWSDAEIDGILPHLGYLHERLVDCLSAVLDRIQPMEARYRLSQLLVREARALNGRPDEAREDLVPLPGIEAIANQLLVIALTDWSIFPAAAEAALTQALPLLDWRDRLIALEAVRLPEVDRRFLDVSTDLEDLKICGDLIEAPSASMQDRLRTQLFIMMETAALLRCEAVSAAGR